MVVVTKICCEVWEWWLTDDLGEASFLSVRSLPLPGGVIKAILQTPDSRSTLVSFQ